MALRPPPRIGRNLGRDGDGASSSRGASSSAPGTSHQTSNLTANPWPLRFWYRLYTWDSIPSIRKREGGKHVIYMLTEWTSTKVGEAWCEESIWRHVYPQGNELQDWKEMNFKTEGNELQDEITLLVLGILPGSGKSWHKMTAKGSHFIIETSIFCGKSVTLNF